LGALLKGVAVVVICVGLTLGYGKVVDIEEYESACAVGRGECVGDLNVAGVEYV